ncbi:MAG TPA: A24 family peptidase [Steroidobacter sp.]
MLAPPSQLDAALILFVLCVAIIDWRTHRIPNLLCTAGAIIGLGSQLWMHGEDGLWSALGGAAVGFSMFLPFYALRAFGAGDVKAMATVGIFLGMRGAMIAVGMTLMAGALLGVAVLLLRPTHTNATLHRLMGLLVSPIASARGTGGATPTESQRFPYGTAIACGTAAALLIVSH